jgi:hypothetical protein
MAWDGMRQVTKTEWQDYIDANRHLITNHEITGLSEPPQELHYDKAWGVIARVCRYDMAYHGKGHEYWIRSTDPVVNNHANGD